jgi:Zn-dependent peptidase ImmA (M78 family)
MQPRKYKGVKSLIPKEVKVAGISYSVEEIDKLKERYDLLGQILYQRGLIQIDSELPKDRKEQVFVHELLHACFYEAGIEEHDEDMINRVGIVLYQALKDNNLSFG